MLASANVGLLGGGAHPDLARVPGCSLGDLHHNLEGRLSPRQSGDLRRSLLHSIVLLGFAVGWCCLAANSGWSLNLLVGVLCLVVMAFRVVREALAFRSRLVAQVEGDVWSELVPDSDGPDSYYVHVAGMKLETQKEIHENVRPGGPYRVFYLPTIKRAVSVQVLPDWRPIPRPVKRSLFKLPISIEF